MIEKLAGPDLILSKEIVLAIKNRQPVVALETAVLTHGLPYPHNIQLSKELEAGVRSEGAYPATVGVLDGRLCAGLSESQIEHLGSPSGGAQKISTRDLGIALACRQSGGTTVAASIFAAHKAGIQVFSTGGIGGVHRGRAFDISADLLELSKRPVIVVCSGAKAILDLPATVEQLDTLAVPVIGYQTDEFPAFYSADSGLPVTVRADSPSQVAAIANAHWGLGLAAALLVVVPPPQEDRIPSQHIETALRQANLEAQDAGIRGSALTPFLLNRVNELTEGKTLKTNLALLKNNARVAAQISAALSKQPGRFPVQVA